MNRGERRPEEESALAATARLSGHGLTLALATGFFLFLGWLADGRLGTTPLLTILGALVGAAAGFYHMLQHLVLFPRKREEERRSSPPSGKPPDRRGDAAGGSERDRT